MTCDICVGKGTVYGGVCECRVRTPAEEAVLRAAVAISRKCSDVPGFIPFDRWKEFVAAVDALLAAQPEWGGE